MKSQQTSVSEYVNNWLKRLKNRNLSQGDEIRITYAFSKDLFDRVKAGSFSDLAIYRELLRHFHPTPARQLIRLQAVDEALIQRAADHCDLGKPGATISHLNYLAKMSKKQQAAALVTSIENELSVSEFKIQAQLVIADGISSRPSIAIRHLRMTAKMLSLLLREISQPGFLDSTSCLDVKRRNIADESLIATAKHLTDIAYQMNDALQAIDEIKSRLLRRDLGRHDEF